MWNLYCDASGTWASWPTGGLTSTTIYSPPHISVPRYITLCMSAQGLVSPLYKPGRHSYPVLIISLLFLFHFLPLCTWPSLFRLRAFVREHTTRVHCTSTLYTTIRVHCTRAAADRLPARPFTEDIGQVSQYILWNIY